MAQCESRCAREGHALLGCIWLAGWHEGYPQRCRRIASSFREFLERALTGGDRIYWLNE